MPLAHFNGLLLVVAGKQLPQLLQLIVTAVTVAAVAADAIAANSLLLMPLLLLLTPLLLQPPLLVLPPSLSHHLLLLPLLLLPFFVNISFCYCLWPVQMDSGYHAPENSRKESSIVIHSILVVDVETVDHYCKNLHECPEH